MNCQFCGKFHVCALPTCGHLRFYHVLCKDECNMARGILVNHCECEKYVESEEEKLCLEEREKEQRWPVEILAAMKLILMTTKRVGKYDLVELVQRGEKIITRVDVSLE